MNVMLPAALSALLGAALILSAPSAIADDAPMSMDHMMMMDGPPKGDTGPASEAFRAANLAMHEKMDITYSGNADTDFAKGMIAHHQGAIDMAQVELKYGTDPEMRKLAQQIIAAQKPEIDWMTQWLSQHAAK